MRKGERRRPRADHGGQRFERSRQAGRPAAGPIILYGWHPVKAALEKTSREPASAKAMETKLIVGRFFMERMLPETGLRLARIVTGADTMMSLDAEMF